MILLSAVVAGLIAGVVRARWVGNRFRLPEIRGLWLVPVAFTPQWFVFYWTFSQRLANEFTAAFILVSSQILLLIFAGTNRRLAPFRVLSLGLLLNFLVIILNGGLMPISPDTVDRVVGHPTDWQERIGQRLGGTKDVVLPVAQTSLPWLADRFVTPAWWPKPSAFSLGDVVIAIGAFWLLWQAGGMPSQENADV